QEAVKVRARKSAGQGGGTAIGKAVAMHQRECFLSRGAEERGQLDFTGQMVKHQKRAVEFDLLHLDIGDGSGEHGAAIGLFADIANEALDHLSLYAAVLDLGEVDFVAFFNLPNKAHVVVTITTTRRKGKLFTKKVACVRESYKIGLNLRSRHFRQAVVTNF